VSTPVEELHEGERPIEPNHRHLVTVSPWALFAAVIGPLMIIAAIGALLQHVGLFQVTNLTPLATLVLTPSLIFSRLSTASISPLHLFQVLLIALIPALAIAVVTHVGLGRTMVRRGLVSDVDRRMAVIVATVPNTGNFGLPLAQALGKLLKSADPRLVIADQTALIMGANVLLWIVAPIYLGAVRSGRENLRLLPIVGALTAALVISTAHLHLPGLVSRPIDWLGDACVPVMLLALGGILVTLRGQSAGGQAWLVAVAIALKLAIVPTAVWGWARWLGQWPAPGQQLMLEVAAPTAVLTSQLGGDSVIPDRVILWSTLLSAGTLPVLSVVLR
jgi:malonate transporter and related proteins